MPFRCDWHFLGWKQVSLAIANGRRENVNPGQQKIGFLKNY